MVEVNWGFSFILPVMTSEPLVLATPFDELPEKNIIVIWLFVIRAEPPMSRRNRRLVRHGKAALGNLGIMLPVGDNPCTSQGVAPSDLTCKNLGPDPVNGRPTVKWQVTQPMGGRWSRRSCGWILSCMRSSRRSLGLLPWSCRTFTKDHSRRTCSRFLRLTSARR